MTIFRLAGIVALGAAFMLAGCSKNSDTSSQSSTTTTAATTAPDAAATSAPETAAPDAMATTSGEATTTTSGTTKTATVNGTTYSTSTGSGSSGFIDLPVYPGASELKDQGMTMSQNGQSLAIKVYDTKDDAKTVSDWYKAHLPAAWKNGIVTSDNKTVGTFANEMSDGAQTIIVATQDASTTRIQLSTKHGK